MNKVRADTLQQIKTRYGDDVIPLQKAIAPFMPFKGGFGYRGMLLYDSTEDKIMCHFCGLWRNQLNGTHLRTHDLTAREYKIETGINQTYGLVSIGTLLLRSKISKANYKDKKAKIVKGIKKYRKSTKGIKMSKLKKGTDMFYNRLGLCEAQLEERLIQLSKKLGRPVASRDNHALTSALRRRFGTFDKAKGFFNMRRLVKGKRITYSRVITIPKSC